MTMYNRYAVINCI